MKFSLNLFTPKFLFSEFSKYKWVILEKTQRSKEDFRNFLTILKEKIQVIHFRSYKDY
ncbi:MAG: hypothetical protein JW776_11730 [Candidatus Lokiarchaeota archaeon]|nr:hypothetical protein [Candidatus Lokiarchaeota archaeon]